MSEELEPRVAALEDEVSDLRSRVSSAEQDAAAARVLAGGADHDMHEVHERTRQFQRATSASLNAIRKDVRDLQRHARAVDARFDAVDGALGVAAAGQQQIVEMLTVLIDRENESGPSA